MAEIVQPPEEGMTFREIYELIMSNGDVIILIPESEVKRVREGLSAFKAKLNQKLKANELPPESSTLEFAILPLDQADPTNLGMTRLQCYLKYPEKIQVRTIEIVDSEDI